METVVLNLATGHTCFHQGQKNRLDHRRTFKMIPKKKEKARMDLIGGQGKEPAVGTTGMTA